MAAVKAKRKRILFVDDEPAFLETIGSIIEQTAGDEWRPFFAESAGKALSLLQEQPMDLVVIDGHMPVIDGVQFLNLVRRRHPQPPKVVRCEFPCRDTNGRLNFLEFVSQRAGQVGRTPEPGELDRLDVLTTESKVVAKIRPDHGPLVPFSQTDPPAMAASPEPEGA